MEIYRVNSEKWVWDDAYGRGHTEHKEIGFFTTREKAERELYLYIAQRIKGVDKDKLKEVISRTQEENKILIKDNKYWINIIYVK